jgi:hypothetical protein
VNALQLVRKTPGPHRGVRRSQAAICAARMERDRRDVAQAAAVHARWLASRATAGIPDLVHLEAARIAGQAEAEGARLRREIHAELEAERQSDTGPRTYIPARRPRMGRSLAPPELNNDQSPQWRPMC